MTASQNDFLSVFILQSPCRATDVRNDYLFEAQLAPLAPAWGFLGIPQLVQTPNEGPEPRLAAAILQAITIDQTT